MSIDGPSAARRLSREKSIPSSLSHSDGRNSSYSKYTDRPARRAFSRTRAMSASDEAADDVASLPSTSKDDLAKRTRRFSELKTSGSQESGDRRASIPQLNFAALLPNLFRSNKHQQQKSPVKEETSTTTILTGSSNNASISPRKETMTGKPETSSPLRLSGVLTNGFMGSSLSTSNDLLSTATHEDPPAPVPSMFVLDASSSELRCIEITMLQLRAMRCLASEYRESFFPRFHTNYCGELEHEGPFLVSLLCDDRKPTLPPSDPSTDSPPATHGQARALIRVPHRNYDVSLATGEISEDHILQVLFNQLHLSAVHSCRIVADPKANEKILLFDKTNDERQNFKIGLLYQRADQTSEYEIFSNDALSTELFEFLQLIADHVQLKGFTRYRGDLDIKDNQHGEYSYHTEYQHHEIMFNVAPIVPSTKANGQCIERKGLVGNAFVCIVFQEPDSVFQPDIISGKVTQVYITVQPTKINDELYYKVSIWHRHEFALSITPAGGTYRCDGLFREYFLTLLLNAITAAIESPNLRMRVLEQRRRLKYEELKKLSHTLTHGQVFDAPSDFENIVYSPSRRNSTVSSMNDTPAATVEHHSSPVLPKKRTFSKFLGVLSSLAGSNSPASPSTPTTNHDTSPVNLSPAPPNPETTSMQPEAPSLKDTVKRVRSVKSYRAPPVPSPSPTDSPRQAAPQMAHPATLSISSSLSNVSSALQSPNDDSSPHNHVPQTTFLQESRRHRSNSSPVDNVIIHKRHSPAIPIISEEMDLATGSPLLLASSVHS